MAHVPIFRRDINLVLKKCCCFVPLFIVVLTMSNRFFSFFLEMEMSEERFYHLQQHSNSKCKVVSLCLVTFCFFLFALLDDFVSARFALNRVRLSVAGIRVTVAAAHLLPLVERLLLACFLVVIVARVGLALAGTALAEIVRLVEDAAL